MLKCQSLLITKFHPAIANISKVTLPKTNITHQNYQNYGSKTTFLFKWSLVRRPVNFQGVSAILLALAPHVTPSPPPTPKSPGESSRWSRVSQHLLAFQICQDLEVDFFLGLKCGPLGFQPTCWWLELPTPTSFEEDVQDKSVSFLQFWVYTIEKLAPL